jgi:Tfp pilus assembly protein PilN
MPSEAGVLEVYGESETRRVFSAEFNLPVDRAAALARAELRLAPEQQAVGLGEAVPQPKTNPRENDLSRNALAYAAALAGACPWLAQATNLLPAEARSANSRRMWIAPAALAVLLVTVAGVLAAHSAYADRDYYKRLQAEMARLEPRARRAAALDREIEQARARTKTLDDFRVRSKLDLDALNELTRLLAPPVWASSVELRGDSVAVAGEAEQAAPLLKIIDASPNFQNAAFNNITRTAGGEAFRLRAERENGR